MASLDDDQEACRRAFCAAVRGKNTIVARAGGGAGKTHTMAAAIACEKGALAFSHTNFACDELRERIEPFHDHDAQVGTIHSVARRLVGEAATEGYDPESGIDYDRMLERAIDALRDPTFVLPPWLATRQYIVVDEYQDTGTDQDTLINLLRHRLSCALVVVGDFAQAIYGFQGATSEHMTKLRMRSDCVEVTLRNNYRSHAAIVEHANRLSHASNGGIHGAIEMRPTRFANANRDASLHLRCYRSDVDLVRAIARWILDRYQQGVLFGGDTLVLYASRSEARDYAGRRLRLVTTGECPPDGTLVTLRGEGGYDKGELCLSPDVVDREDASGIVVLNPQRRILVACRKVADRRQLLNQVFSNLITRADNRLASRDIFITDRDNKPENDDGKRRMRSVPVCLSTVHGAKGGEWDSVLHIDLGESLKRYSRHDDEEHRILYVSHTRAIDELWHVGVCTSEHSLTRYMTDDLVAHFCAESEPWESEAPATVPPVFFDPTFIVPPEIKTELLSVTEVAETTKTVWEPTEERPPVQEVVWQHTPKIRELPKDLHILNAAHGVFLEWVCLWHMHESATRQDILEFLQAILRRYSVNKAFAMAMQRVFDDGSADECERIRAEFDRLRLSTNEAEYATVGRLHELVSAALDRVCPDPASRPVVRVSDVKTAMNNVRMQQLVRLDSEPRRCPVRPTIRHFDSHTGADSWKLDDIPGLKQYVLIACRSVFARLGRANTTNKFVCLLFMQSVQMMVAGKMAIEPNEQAWRILLTVLQDRQTLSRYVAYIDAQMAAIRADAQALREHVNVTAYQSRVDAVVAVEHKKIEDNAAAYAIAGRADATSDNAVLEVTSRDANYKTKVQQAHLYAGMLDKREIYNYYIENRLLVRRTRSESADEFMQRSAEDLVIRRGLPGLREKVDRASLFAEWNVRVQA